MKIHNLSKKDARKIYDKIIKKWLFCEYISKFTNIKIIEIEKYKKLIIFPNFKVININDCLIPFLGDLNIIQNFLHQICSLF